MKGKVCCFFGHRKIEKTEELVKRLDEYVEMLIREKNVKTFLFGSRSEFDDLCHERVTRLQEKYPDIRRIAYKVRSEYVVKKEEKEERERIARAVLKREVYYKDYDGEIMSDRVFNAGKASYVERNQEMIDTSDFCIVYYNPQYQPPKRKYSKRSIGEYQPKSGTALAYEYACQRLRGGKDLTICNLFEKLL